MKQNLGSFIAVVLLLLMVSCAAQFPLIASTTFSEATELKVLCGQSSIEAADVKKADSLYAAGKQLLEKKKNKNAYALLDQSIVLYRVALTENSIAAKEKAIVREENALAKTKKDLSAYKQVLKQLKTMEQQ
jgi:hypothetical protein